MLDRLSSLKVIACRQTDLNKNQARFAMSEENDPSAPEHIPFFQRVLDNPFLLLFLGVVFPTVFYIMWGIMEIATIPVAP